MLFYPINRLASRYIMVQIISTKSHIKPHFDPAMIQGRPFVVFNEGFPILPFKKGKPYETNGKPHSAVQRKVGRIGAIF